MGVYSFFLIPNNSLAQDLTYNPLPSPYIKSPNSSTPPLVGVIQVTIGIAPASIEHVEVQAVDSAGKVYSLGYATRQSQGTTDEIIFSRSWNTNNFTPGQYRLKAIAFLVLTLDGMTNLVPTYSPEILVTVAKEPGGSPTPRPESSSPLPAPVISESSSEEITTPETKTPGKTSNLKSTPGANASPTSSPSLTDLLANSTVLATVRFRLDQDKPLNLAKIEGRLSSAKTKFLYFQGRAFADSFVTLAINSQPLVLSSKADSSGNWTYVLENPLEPGKHETYIEVNREGQIEKSGPYPFTIAQAQATTDNPTGASLDLVDPQKQALKTYLYAAALLVGLAILVIAFYLYFKRAQRLSRAMPPIKEG